MLPLALSLLLLAIGLVLLVAEDVLPTGGALGLLAAGCLIVVLHQGFAESSAMGYRYLAAEAFLVPSAYGASAYLMAKTPMGRATYLRPPEADELGVSHAAADLGRLVGERGRALTTLRPSGMVDFEGRRLDGVAEQGLIPLGASVLAVRARSGRLIVRAEPEGPPGGPGPISGGS